MEQSDEFKTELVRTDYTGISKLLGGIFRIIHSF